MRKCRYLKTAGSTAFRSPLKAFHNACHKRTHNFSLWRLPVLQSPDSAPKEKDGVLFTTEILSNLPVIFLLLFTLFVYTKVPYFSHLQFSLFNISLNLNVESKGFYVFTLMLHLCFTQWRNCLKASVLLLYSVLMGLFYSGYNVFIIDILKNE